MKYKSLLLLFCMTVVFCMDINAQATHTIELVYNDEDFELIGHENNESIFSKLDGLVWDSDTLVPALPYICVNVLIGPDEEYSYYSYSNTENLYKTNIVIAPNKKPVATNLDFKEMQKADDIIYSNIDYPVTSIVYTGTNIMDGYKYAGFLVCPFRYNSFEKKLYLKKITLNVMTTAIKQPTNNVMTDVVRYKNMHDAVASLVCNPHEVDVLYRNMSSSIAVNEYVIVTNRMMASTFQKLADWKTKKGVRAKVITTEDIYNNYEGNTPQLKIKNALYNLYNMGMKYVLLGGDVNIVPAQICKLPDMVQDIASESPADIFYSCFDNSFDWDGNCNGVYGEKDDDIDFAPEVILTRCSVGTINEAQNFVDRILNYESNPNVNNWKDNILMGGIMLSYNRIIDGETVSDAQLNSEKIYKESIQPFWDCELVRFFDTYSDIPNTIPNNFHPRILQQELSKGYTFFDMNSHGHYGCWGWFYCGNDSSYLYDTSFASSLVNSRNTIITTEACNTNAFDLAEYDILSEVFMRNVNSGIIAYLGSSREGWSVTSDVFNKQFYKNLLSGKDKRFGSAVMNMKKTFSSSYGYSKYYRWLYYTINPLGDPEMPVFVSIPKTINNPAILYTNGRLTVNTNLDDCNICISTKNTTGIDYYKVTSFNNYYSQNNLSGELTLSITKDGYIPYICRIGDNVYLQNEEFIENNAYVKANKVFAGNNVVNTKQQGNVVIASGTTNVIYKDFVILDSGFEVKLGSEFNVTPRN